MLDLSDTRLGPASTLALNGEWWYYDRSLKEDLREPGNAATPELAPVPEPWLGRGYGTLRLNVRIPESDVGRLFAVHLNQVETSYRLWLDDRLLHANGRVGRSRATSEGNISPALIVFRAPAKEFQLDLEVANFIRSKGGLRSAILFGPYEAMLTATLRRATFELFLTGSLAIMAIYYVGLFLQRRRESFALFFAVLALTLTVRQLSTGERALLFYFPNLDYELAFKIAVLSGFAALPALLMFVRYLFPTEVGVTLYRHIYVVLLAAALTFCGLMACSPIEYYEPWMPYYMVLILAGMGYCLWIAGRAVVHRRPGSTIFLIGYSFLLVTGVNDILYGTGRLQTTYLAPLGLFIFLATQSIVLSRRFTHSLESVERLSREIARASEDLEERIRERTMDLESALEELRELKERQDGDYYLTSLLLKPFTEIQVFSETVDVSAYTQQNKSFEYRSRRVELGGDLSTARTIVLGGVAYTVFLNGDAMGKSMQGAGGALVLGAIFEAILESTSISGVRSRLSPERWLRDAFFEIHRIFQGFGGAMMVSMIFGLVDDRNGFVYYVNAEHPSLVHLRDGRAGYLPVDGGISQKPGVPNFSEDITILTHHLASGETLIAGSDGRDDVVLGEDRSGREVWNEDPERFLRLVESTGGDPRELTMELMHGGTQADDVSLLALTYRRHDRDAGNADEKVHALRQRLREALKARRFEIAAKLAVEILAIAPGELHVIYSAALAFKELRDYERAMDYVDRFYLRRPNSTRNLLLKAELWYHLEEYVRAYECIYEFLKSHPKNKRGLELKRHLEKLARM